MRIESTTLVFKGNGEDCVKATINLFPRTLEA